MLSHRTLLVLTLLVPAARSSSMITAVSPLPWLQITSSAGPQFQSAVDAAVAPNVVTMISQVLPYSVVITNAGSQPLIGLDVRFVLKLAAGTVVRNYFYHSFPQPEKPLLPPGRSILIAPLVSANSLAGGAVPKQGGAGRSLTSTGDQEALQLLASAEELDISVDLAVASDGRTAGPDLAGTVKAQNDQRDAYSTLRSECLARMASGYSDAAIEAWLTPISEQKLFEDVPKTHTLDFYARTQLQFAQEWLASLKAGQRADLQAELNTVTPDMVFPVVSTLRGGLQ